MTEMAWKTLLFWLLCSGLLLVPAGCYQVQEKDTAGAIVDAPHLGPIVNGADVVFDDSRQALLQLLGAIDAPRLETMDVDAATWHFAPGDPAEGLQVSIADLPPLDTLVALPHRILKPDWPLWYQRVIEPGNAGWLFVNADDGAQVFQDGALLTPTLGAYFKLSPAESTTLTIRVLNNAMHGGLRDVRFIEAAAYEAYRAERAVRLEMTQVLFEALRRDTLAPEETSAVKAMLATPAPHTVDAARRYFESRMEYPELPAPDASAGDGVFSFTAWGDSQGGWETFQALIDQMLKSSEDAFSIGLGDLVSFGAQEEQWLAFTAALQPLLERHPVFAVAGNHDYDGYYNTLVPELYYQYTRREESEPAYFSWKNNGAYFIALDPNGSFPLAFDSLQVDWMMKEMASPAWEAANWRFILMHQAPYAQGWPGYHGDAFIKNMIDSLAAPKGIDFVLTGHNHDYERLQVDYAGHATQFFILGGAGGGLEPEASSDYPQMDHIIKKHHFARFFVTPETVTVQILDEAGKTLDRTVVQR